MALLDADVRGARNGTRGVAIRRNEVCMELPDGQGAAAKASGDDKMGEPNARGESPRVLEKDGWQVRLGARRHHGRRKLGRVAEHVRCEDAALRNGL